VSLDKAGVVIHCAGLGWLSSSSLTAEGGKGWSWGHPCRRRHRWQLEVVSTVSSSLAAGALARRRRWQPGVVHTSSLLLTAGCGGLVVVIVVVGVSSSSLGWCRVVLVAVVNVEVGVVVRRASLPSTMLGMRVSVVSAQRGVLTCHGRRRRRGLFMYIYLGQWDLKRC